MSSPLSELHFRKSSYSNPQNCVEVALTFRKSSYSAGANECVEVADLPTGAAMRDSKRPDAGHLGFASGEWDAFLTAVKGDRL
ncbi:hypothetical protein HDA32_005749 [Spinactinospora alkalitolerans]|uniref:DUF397 domain-containing protein n=1 Tax=Spinactinospora alkalitolerans TaxID=687207 RepID=A0A852U357_9ACTN|nr:DUF397 domain-containing protein [Spinactinospora alkalitolerans]NYE50629.1 hypothetical protein [Spinactinospora alkalitolerans]